MPNSQPAPARIAPRWSLAPSFRLRRLRHDAWHHRSVSIVLAGLLPVLVLAAVGRAELAIYPLSGSLMALFAHGVPYRRRALVHLGLLVGWTLGVAVSLAVAAGIADVPTRIAVMVLVAAVTKVVVDVHEIGAPGAVIPIFVFTGLMFSPQSWSDVGPHLALAAVGSVSAWLVVMTPALLRRPGPEVRAVRRAAELAQAAGEPGSPGHAAAFTAIHDAWALLDAAVPSPGRYRELAGVLDRAEHRLTHADQTVDTVRSRPDLRWTPHRPERRRAGMTERMRRAFLPGSAHLPYFWRLLLASAGAAYLSYFLGAERPYWAVVTVAAVIQPTITATYHRVPQRALGAVVGVLVFAVLAPQVASDPLFTAVTVLLLNAGAEFFVPRNYLLGQVLVTPMALFIAEFGRTYAVADLAPERILDTFLGVALALVATLVVVNPHLQRAVPAAIAALDAATDDGQRVARDSAASALERAGARRRILAARAALHTAVQQADAQWWARAYDVPAVAGADGRAHRALVALRERELVA